MLDSDIAAVIFDMDGVIVDSEPLHLRAWQLVLSNYQINYAAEDHQHFLGRKDLFMADQLTQRFSLSLSPDQLVHAKESIYLNLIQEHAMPRPGLMKILNEARSCNMPCGLASSATIPTIELTISVLGLESYFQSLTSGDEVEHGKPAPDIFLLAAKRLGAQPEHCVVIEDTLNGIRAAKNAGMVCFAIPCDATRHQDHSLADRRLNSLDEICLTRQ